MILGNDVFLLFLSQEYPDCAFARKEGCIAVGVVMALIPPPRRDDRPPHGNRLHSRGRLIDPPGDDQGRFILRILVDLIGANNPRSGLAIL